MKSKKKKQSIELRKMGYSMNSISKELDVSKSSVSLWVRDIKLSEIQIQKLRSNMHTNETIEKRRRTRLKNEESKRQKVMDIAYKQIKNISRNNLFFIGISLYLGEGTKKKSGVVEFVNSDPKLIQIMMKFFKEVCNVSEEKFRGHIHLHSHLSNKKAEKYWSKISNIPNSQFFKTSQQHNKTSKNKKDSLPYGTMSIYICDTKLQLSMKAWMESLGDKVLQIHRQV